MTRLSSLPRKTDGSGPLGSFAASLVLPVPLVYAIAALWTTSSHSRAAAWAASDSLASYLCAAGGAAAGNCLAASVDVLQLVDRGARLSAAPAAVVALIALVYLLSLALNMVRCFELCHPELW